MSDTPRLDALLAEYPTSSDPTCNTAKEIELEFLARQLERELTVANEKAHTYYCQLTAERERRVRAEAMLKDLIASNRANDFPLTSVEENMVAVIAAAKEST